MALSFVCLREFLVLEAQGKEQGDHQRISGKDVPCRTPIGHLGKGHIVVYHQTRRPGAEGGTQAVGHKHEKPLCR